MAKEMSRRTFLKQGAAAAIGLAVVPSTVLGKKFGYTAPVTNSTSWASASADAALRC